jgi:hypothetical protein
VRLWLLLRPPPAVLSASSGAMLPATVADAAPAGMLRSACTQQAGVCQPLQGVQLQYWASQEVLPAKMAEGGVGGPHTTA